MRYLESTWLARTDFGKARLVGLAGAVLVLAALALWALFLVVLFPVDPSIPDTMQRAIAVQVLFALMALVGVVVPWRIPSAIIFSVAFFGSFVWGLGWYFVLTPALAPVGLGDFLYLFAAAMMGSAVWAARRPAHEGR